MTGRKGLTWVTALTVASLLLGGGALTALADGHGGGNKGGGGQGNAAHQQQNVNKPDVSTSEDNGKHEGDDRGPASVSVAGATAQGHGGGRGPEARHTDEVAGADVRNDDDRDDDDTDLITRPDRVTDEVRPGLGCGDKNHEHEREDECKKMHTDVPDVENENDEGGS